MTLVSKPGHLGFLEDLTNPHYQKHFDRLFEFVPGSNIDPVYFDSRTWRRSC
jgi:hypothetical protein